MDEKDFSKLIERLERTAQLCESQAEKLDKIADMLLGTAHHRALAEMARAFHEEAHALKSHMRTTRGNFGEFQAERIEQRKRRA